MAIHFSIGSVFLLVCALSFVSAQSDPEPEPTRAKCCVHRNGKLRMFSGEEQNVQLPCKYRLADYKCQGYHVKVTPGSRIEEGTGKFHPYTVWVSITGPNKDKWVGGTSSELLKKASADPTVSVWTVKTSDLDLIAVYRSNSKRAVVKHPQDLFKVEFTEQGTEEDGVKVTCEDPDFTSEAYPVSLCGLPPKIATQNAVATHKLNTYKFPDLPKDQVIVADVLGQSGVTQSSNCEKIAAEFQACPSQNQVAKLCAPVFTIRPAAKCLVQRNDVTAFDQCQAWVCKGNSNACTQFRETVDKTCTEFKFDEFFQKVDCA